MIGSFPIGGTPFGVGAAPPSTPPIATAGAAATVEPGADVFTFGLGQVRPAALGRWSFGGDSVDILVAEPWLARAVATPGLLDFRLARQSGLFAVLRRVLFQ